MVFEIVNSPKHDNEPAAMATGSLARLFWRALDAFDLLADAGEAVGCGRGVLPRGGDGG